jgi:hypothetical protein
MHDTCTTAEAAAKLIIAEKNEQGIEHFGEEAWAVVSSILRVYMREAHARRARPRRSLDRSRRPFLPRPLAPLVRPLGLDGGSAKKWPNRSLYRRVAR